MKYIRMHNGEKRNVYIHLNKLINRNKRKMFEMFVCVTVCLYVCLLRMAKKIYRTERSENCVPDRRRNYQMHMAINVLFIFTFIKRKIVQFLSFFQSYRQC